MRLVGRIAVVALTIFTLVVLTLLGTLSFMHCSWPAPVRISCILLYLTSSVAVLARVRPWRRTRNLLFALFGLVVITGCFMWPSNDRDWQTPVERLAYATVDGESVRFHNIRNFEYTSESEFMPAYYDKTFELLKLESLDVYLVNWGIEQVSHKMLSFGFGNDDYLCFSFETRTEKGESFSTTKGFFRKYELYCVVANERDVVRLRTNIRKGENVYLYRLKPRDKGNVRRLFMEYVAMVNGLRDRADWYNALTDNCMTSAFKLARINAAEGGGKLHWKIIFNGYADELAYERGTIDTSLPFDELKQVSRINDRAITAGDSPEFSRLIRIGLPGMMETDM